MLYSSTISSFKTTKHRKEKRNVKNIPIFYRFRKVNIPWQKSRTLNISEDGMCAFIYYPVNAGEEIEVEMPHLNNGVKEIIKITAEVTWRTEYIPGQYKCGIHFKQKEVRYRRDERASSFDTDTEDYDTRAQDVEARPVQSVSQIQDAYRMLYKEYSISKLCEPNEGGMHYVFQNLLPESRTFVLRKDDSILGTVSCIPDNPCGLPMEITFPEEIRSLREKGMRLVEAGQLALNSEYLNRSSGTMKNNEKQANLFKLFKVMVNYSRLLTGSTDMIIGCHPRHQRLYKHFYFEAIGEVRNHRSVRDNPAVLMKMNFELLERNTALLKGSMDYMLRDVDVNMLKEHLPWSPEVVKEFSLDHFMNKLTPSQKEYLKYCYS